MVSLPTAVAQWRVNSVAAPEARGRNGSSTPEGRGRVPSRPDYATRSQPDAWLAANLDDELDTPSLEGATGRLKLVDRRHAAPLFEITNYALTEVSEPRQSGLR